MSRNSEKDKIETQTFEEFKKVELDLLEKRYDRYVWTVKEWKQIIGRKFIHPLHIANLYKDGSRAFFYGNFSASILTTTAAIELTLKAIVDLSLMPSSMKKTFRNVINEAIKQKIISDKLASDLHFLRKNTRNVLTHRQDMTSHMTVGWEKDPESETGFMLSDERLKKLNKLQRGAKSLFRSREVFAKETIQLLFQVFKSCINSGRNWSNMVEK